jgi:hypothetical protein
VHGVMALPLAWLDGTEAVRWWLAAASRAAHMAEQWWSSVRDGEEEKWERPSPTVPTRGIRPASPRGTMAIGGVSSPHAVSRVRTTGTVG